VKLWNNNPLAPAWLLPGFECDHPGRFYQYVLASASVESQTNGLQDQPFLFDGDGCFEWRAAAAGVTGSITAYLQIRDHNGRYLSNQPLLTPGWAGEGDTATPIVPALIVPSGALWSYNVLNAVSEPDFFGNVYFILTGAKLGRAGGAQ